MFVYIRDSFDDNDDDGLGLTTKIDRMRRRRPILLIYGTFSLHAFFCSIFIVFHHKLLWQLVTLSLFSQTHHPSDDDHVDEPSRMVLSIRIFVTFFFAS